MPFFGKRKLSAQRQCEFCGEFFQVRSSWPSQRFCSNACYAESIRRIRVTKEELEYWYYELGMNSIEIAEQLGCNDRHLRAIMEEFGLALRNKSEAAIEYPCFPFSGDRIEKAYLIVFRLGEVYHPISVMRPSAHGWSTRGLSRDHRNLAGLLRMFPTRLTCEVSSLTYLSLVTFSSAACAPAKRATGIRNGEHET